MCDFDSPTLEGCADGRLGGGRLRGGDPSQTRSTGDRSWWQLVAAQVIKKGRRLTDVDDAIAKGGNVNASREPRGFAVKSSCWFRFLLVLFQS